MLQNTRNSKLNAQKNSLAALGELTTTIPRTP